MTKQQRQTNELFNKVLDALDLIDKGSPGRWVSFVELFRRHNWHRIYGATMLVEVRNSLLECEEMLRDPTSPEFMVRRNPEIIDYVTAN